MYNNFKVGDKVVWIGPGDVGVVIDIDIGGYLIKWLTGDDEGEINRLTDLYLEPYEEPSTVKYTPRPHAEVIKAWADGAEIEEWNKYIQEWEHQTYPAWCSHLQYRIKEKLSID